MGKRGQPKTPASILKLHGSRLLEHRKEPSPVLGDFSCPKDLSPDAAKFWRRWMPVLERVGVMSMQDLPVFHNLCDAWSDYQAVRDFRDYYIKIKLRAEILRLASHFGMTPSTRSDVQFDNKDKDNPFINMAIG